MSFLEKAHHRFETLSGRSRAIGMFFATSVAGRALGIGCQLLQVPIAMHALGAEAFGLWMTLTGVGAMIALADFGIGQGAQNKLAEAFAAKEETRARELWGSAVVMFAAVGALLAAVLALVGPTLDFVRLFDLSDPRVQREAAAAVGVTLGLFCLNFPLGLAQRLAYSRQKGWMHNVVLAAGSVGGLGGTILATQLGWSLPAVIASAQLPLVAGHAVLLLQQLNDLRWIAVTHWRARWSTMRELSALGACFGVQQVQLTLFVALPQVIISTTLGAAAVTPYNLAQRFFNLFGVVQSAFMLPLWPAYSDAKAKRDFQWIRRTLRLSIAATVGGTMVPMAIGAMFAQPILALWVGADAGLPSVALIWLMFAWNALVFVGQPFGYMLAGLSEVKQLTQYAVVSSLLSVGLMALLVRSHGTPGVVTGMIVGFLPFLVRGNIVEALRQLRHFPRTLPVSEPLVHATSALETRS